VTRALDRSCAHRAIATTFATQGVIDGTTGEVMTAQLFVAVLGASSYVYSEATWSHARLHLLWRSDGDGGQRQLGHHQGVLLRAGGQPHLRRDGGALQHSRSPSTAISRPGQSQGRSGAHIATRFIIAKLRNRQFFSLCALNVAIAELVAEINNRVSRHLGALFEDVERSALKA
jgi:hypothetical protein